MSTVAPSVPERLAEIEAQLASSWALRTRSEYEADVRNHLKNDLMSYVTKLAVGALVLLGGAGYLFVKSAVVDVYQSQNEKIIAELRAKHNDNLAEERLSFEWKSNHDYGKNYVYLAEFYANSGIPAEVKGPLLERQFKRARTYFEAANHKDPRHASTYWELGELYYSYPRAYGLPQWIDLNRALSYYEEGSKLYSDDEVSEGWRGDTFRLIGRLKLERAKVMVKEDDIKRLLASAQESLEKARDDYTNVVREWREYHEPHLKEVNQLLLSLSDGKDGWREAISDRGAPQK